jgi:hypothetical protein
MEWVINLRRVTIKPVTFCRNNVELTPRLACASTTHTVNDPLHYHNGVQRNRYFEYYA